MTRSSRLRALFALALLALSLFVIVTVPVRLGLDLRGGTQIVLETRSTPVTQADREATDQTLEVLRGRIDALGLAEPTLVRSGSHRIIVELPGVQDPGKAAEVLGRTAQLTFHQVLGTTDGTDDDTSGPLPERPEGRVLPDESGEFLLLTPATLTGEGVKGAAARFDQQEGAGWHVTVDFDGAGRDVWSRMTGEAACHPAGVPQRRVAIVLDDRIISSPQVDPSLACRTGISGGSTQITGSFTDAEARELALLINGGALPVPVETVEQHTVGAALGERAVTAAAWAAVIGTALTGLFIVVVYRLAGALAVVALACYGVISYAALAALGATLTLPGLAGFVLAIGMAVDANVLVFERAREEYSERRHPSARSALTAGFRNAFSAIADSNVTTLIAAALLFFLGSGPVKGFGVTLGIGVLASMLSALVITRVLAESVMSRRWLRRRPQLTGIATTGAVRDWLMRRTPRLIRRPRRWLAVSAAVLVVAASGIVVRGMDLGIEFTGGRLIQYSTSRPVDPERARAVLAETGVPRAVVQSSGDTGLTVRAADLTDSEAAAVTRAVGALGGDTDKVRDELIGPSLGEELRRNALVALVVALSAQLVYLAVRFRWRFGVAAVSALVHDVLILVGVFSWIGKPFDGVFLAALLTVVGYSVNDSVVVFDRIRELLRRDRAEPLADATNRAVLQTLPRTVNTGLGACLILTALTVLGQAALSDFALALLIGVAVGTYSSVFTAAPVAIELHRRASRRGPRGGERRRAGQGLPAFRGGDPQGRHTVGRPARQRLEGGGTIRGEEDRREGRRPRRDDGHLLQRRHPRRHPRH